jgi:hypothetical protein
LDYPPLERRATDQYDVVDRLRLDAASAAFTENA